MAHDDQAPYTIALQKRSPLAALAALAIGLVLGFLLGGIAPRTELAEREAAIVELEQQLAAADTGGWRSPVPGFDRILRAPEAERASPEAPAGRVPEEPAAETPVDDPDGGVPRARWRDRWADQSPDNRLGAFQRAASVQQVRRMQSRAALVQQADLSDPEIEALDDALGEMNDALQGHGEELLILALGQDTPAPGDLLGITHDVTGILHRGQLRVEALLGPGRTADVEPSALEIWNHVDLSRLEPAARAATGARP